MVAVVFDAHVVELAVRDDDLAERSVDHDVPHGDIFHDACGPVFQLDAVADLKRLVQADHHTGEDVVDHVLRGDRDHSTYDRGSAEHHLPHLVQPAEK